MAAIRHCVRSSDDSWLVQYQPEHHTETSIVSQPTCSTAGCSTEFIEANIETPAPMTTLLTPVFPLHSATSMYSDWVMRSISSRYSSSSRLDLIKEIFRTKQGSSFGELKQLQAFLLLSNTQLQCDPRLISRARSAAELVTAERLPDLCTCGYREKMAALLGWNYGKSINLFIAAVAYGPAIAYCVPEKKQILRFLAHYLISINPYTPKIDLQDHLYSLLIIRLNTSLFLLRVI